MEKTFLNIFWIKIDGRHDIFLLRYAYLSIASNPESFRKYLNLDFGYNSEKVSSDDILVEWITFDKF